ncbi:hypothetical protein AB0H18_36955, partial [Streptomyces sp. NPDC020766]|uniref:hypothetical protein n=1 Tax=Streptomyces sp. NPDC020766 TaxID=3155011 RepID=UPI0033E97DEB
MAAVVRDGREDEDEPAAGQGLVEAGRDESPVTPLYRAPELEALKRHDRTRHFLRLPNLFDV